MKTNKNKLMAIVAAMAIAATPVLAKEIYQATKNEIKVMVNNQKLCWQMCSILFVQLRRAYFVNICINS